MSALLVIDVQNDFLDDGAFALKSSRSIIPAINAQIAQNYDLVVASRDWHPSDHVSFATTQSKDPYSPIELHSGEKTLKTLAWPTHCVQNTWGAQLDSDLDSRGIDEIVNKGTNSNEECFSAFLDVFKEKQTGLHALLQKYNIKTVTVVGVVTEYCVSQTAFDAVEFGYETRVLQDCIFPITKEGGAAKIKELQAKGVKVL